MAIVLGVLPWIVVFLNLHENLTDESKATVNVIAMLLLIVYLVFGIIL